MLCTKKRSLVAPSIRMLYILHMVTPNPGGILLQEQWNNLLMLAFTTATRVSEQHGIKESKESFELYLHNTIHSTKLFADHILQNDEPLVILNVQKDALKVAAGLYSTTHEVHGEVVRL